MTKSRILLDDTVFTLGRVPVTRSMAWMVLVGQAWGIRLLRARVLIHLAWMIALRFGRSRGTILSWTSLLLMRRSISGHFPSSPDSDRNLRMFGYSWGQQCRDSIRRMRNVVRSPLNASLTSLHRQGSTSLTRKTGHGARHPQQAKLSRKTDATAETTRDRQQHSAKVSTSFNQSRTGQVKMSAPDSITEAAMSCRNTKLSEAKWRPRAPVPENKARYRFSSSDSSDSSSQDRRSSRSRHRSRSRRRLSTSPNRTHLISQLIVNGNAAHQCQSWNPLMVSRMNGTRSSSIFVRSLITISGPKVRSEIVCWPAFGEKPWPLSGVSPRRHTLPTAVCGTLWMQGLDTWSYHQQHAGT